ncbi:pyridoxamine 5'-phosphate oxidase family protein [Rhodococcus sp. ABRD24]|uniref:pyridoxamine 5'-phosphate oxidase family protein n=1 Tax=Rhodococcus sp. ABRD24 TaxID=2507582 RepID=UPI00103F1BCE|nr:pyridoxamine 5'-phosphate oxidase family protein [Rhodococcus sp. ABRD24]QBJ95854.1 pyridoxamine 5'-phosphate oxidase family protein [Rhodococcus sp. ABRD24]
MPDQPRTTGPVTALTEQESWEQLRTGRLGRLVVVIDGTPEIYPVNYAVREDKVYFRTAEGDKLAEITVHPQVAFQADHADDTAGWSVVVHGAARTLVRFDEINAAEALDLQSWVPTDKFNFVEIRPTSITGRRFVINRG